MRVVEKYQGEPCIYDHNGVRYRKGGHCVECSCLASAKQHAAVRTERLRDKAASREAST